MKLGAPKTRTILLICLGTFTMNSCGVMDNYLYPENKFYSANIDDVHENTDPLPAKIVLSEPQVFSRAVLQNDRMEEAKHLKQMLDESPTLTYEAQLRRDLSLISILTGELGIKFDPTSALAFEQDSLRHEIQTTKLRGELLSAQRQLDALQKSDAINEDTNDGKNDDSQTSESFKNVDLTDIKTNLKTLMETTETLLGKVDGEIKQARESGIETSPEDRYASMQAYRAMVQSDLSEAKLDDLHDLTGNALYRLQFMANIFPGPDKNRWGVTRVKLLPPNEDDKDYDLLYLRWLAYLTVKINHVENGKLNQLTKGQQSHQHFYFNLATNTNTFSIHEYYFPLKEVDQNKCVPGAAERKNPNICGFIYLAVSPKTEPIDELMQTSINTNKFLSKTILEKEQKDDPEVKKFNKKEQTPAQIMAFAKTKLNRLPEQKKKEKMQAICKSAADRVEQRNHTIPETLLGLQALESGIRLPQSIKSAIARQKNKLLDNDVIVQSDIKRLSKIAACGEPEKQVELSPEEIRIAAPDRFKNELKTLNQSYNTRVYATIPNQRDQRLSTIASAANTMQMAFALEATVPQYGVGLNAGLGYLRSMMGKIDALERAPIVTGFSGECWSAKADTCKENNAAWLGWIFGPKVRVDSQGSRLKLNHVVARHQVGGDVSIPAWWPSVELQIESVWVGSWSAFPINGENIPEAKPQKMTIHLPITISTLDELTHIMAVRDPIFALVKYKSNTSIDRVVPQEISVCDRNKTFLIHGDNLWRNPEVYLNSLQADKIKFLPDMAGLRATFDLSKISFESFSHKLVPLQVYTSHGPSEYMILVRDKHKAGKCLGQKAEELKFKPPPRFMNNENLTFHVSEGSIRSGFLELALRIHSSQDEYEWQKVEGVLSVDGKTIVSTNALKITDKRYKDGTILDAALMITSKKGVLPKVIRSERKPVFFSAASAKSKIQVPTSSLSDIGPSKSILITLPLKWEKAYPDLKGLKAELSTKAGDKKIQLAVKPALSSDIEGELKIEFHFKSPSDRATYNALRKKDDLNLKLIPYGTSSDLPQVEGVLKIKKKS